MKKLSMILATWTVAMASVASASEVYVHGRSSAEQQYGAGQTIVTSDFEVTYRNENLPWGTRVALVAGYRCTNKGSWTNRDYPNEMHAVSSYAWQARFTKTTGDRYLGLCRNLEFVFEITLPDGSKYFDNGMRAPMGFYSAAIPYWSTDNGTLQPMAIRALSSAQEYQD